MKPWKQLFFVVCFLWFFYIIKGKDTRKDGRLQDAVKEESSPLKRQQDFGQEILISKHVRTQTNLEPRAAILLNILPFTDL